jgi:hypothetical protein
MDSDNKTVAEERKNTVIVEMIILNKVFSKVNDILFNEI